jgi:hypothetical protein
LGGFLLSKIEILKITTKKISEMYGPPSPRRSLQRHCPSVDFFGTDGWNQRELIDILRLILTSNPPDAASTMKHALEYHGMQFKPEDTPALSKLLSEYMKSPRSARPELVRFLYKKGVLSCVDGLADILYRTGSPVLADVISEELVVPPLYLEDRERKLRRPGSFDIVDFVRLETYDMAGFVQEISSTGISPCVPEIPGCQSWNFVPKLSRTMTFLLCMRRALHGAENLQGVPREMWLEIIKHISVYDILIRRSPLK